MNSTMTQWILCLALASAGPCPDTSRSLLDDVANDSPAEPAATGAGSARPGEAAPAAHAPQQTKTTQSYMRAHTAEALAMRRAAITGKLPELQAAAASIASDSWSPHLRPDYQPHVDAVRAAARGAAEAASLDTAIMALGRLGGECASCHRAVGGPPQPPDAASPLAVNDPMKAHAAAEEAMWIGLTFPSDASWAKGAQGLIDATPIDSDVQVLSEAAARTKALARAALPAGAPRPELYGKILATCSSCHTRVDVTVR